MKRLLMMFCAVMVMTATAQAAFWSDNFDGYPPGKLNGPGGWMGWDNVMAAAGTVTAANWLSSPHSLGVSNTLGNDAIHPFTPITSGPWVLTCYQ